MAFTSPLIVISSSFLGLIHLACASTIINAQILNDRPIIGVLAQELSHSLKTRYGDQNFSSYIAASYVKYLEAAGARVVPIMINQEDSYYEEMANSLNGLLIPGGANFYNDSGYGLAGGRLYDLAVSMNERGDYFPVWGTCLGFELLLYLIAGRQDARQPCDAWDRADALIFEPEFLNSRMLSSAPDQVLDILTYQPVTANFHRFCVTKQGLANAKVDVKILATSMDRAGLRYVAAFESRSMPFYGVQFHPEKVMYEWNTRERSIPHSSSAVLASNYFAQFFVNEARRSGHKFATFEREQSQLIYNYTPTFSAAKNATFEQCYFFSD